MTNEFNHEFMASRDPNGLPHLHVYGATLKELLGSFVEMNEKMLPEFQSSIGRIFDYLMTKAKGKMGIWDSTVIKGALSIPMNFPEHTPPIVLTHVDGDWTYFLRILPGWIF